MRLSEKKLAILQNMVNKIDGDKYYPVSVECRRDGIYLVPIEPRWFGDEGEYMGATYEMAKINIKAYCQMLDCDI